MSRQRTIKCPPGKVVVPRLAQPGMATEPPHAVLASEVTRRVLANGMVILVKQIYPAAVVSLSLWARVGAIDEPDSRAGISHFVEHMLFKNTENRGVGQIAQEIHNLGGYLNGFTSYDCTCYYITVPGEHFCKALEIQTDAVLHPLFDPDEAAKEVRVIIEELRMYEDRPSAYAFQRLMETAYRQHRFSRPIIGYEEVLEAITPQDLADYYWSHYGPNNLAVVVVGDVDPESTLAALDNTFGDLPFRPVTHDPSPQEHQQRRYRTRDLRGRIEAGQFQMAFHIPSIFSPDIFACDLLATILGGGRSSRLYQSIRERRGLVTSIESSIMQERDPGLFVIDAVLTDEKVKKVESAIFEEITRLHEDLVAEPELAKAKNMVESHYIYAQETVEAQMRILGTYEMLGNYTLADRYIQELYRVTAQDIRETARRYLRPSNGSRVAYLPAGH